MVKNILEYFPNKDNYNTYIEPFGGSFGVALHNPNVPTNEIYNDLDQNVYSLFRVLVDDNLFTKFQKKCDCIFYCEEMRNKYRNELKEMEFEDTEEHLVDRAFKFFYVNRTSRNDVGGFSLNLCVRRNMSKSCSDMLSTVEGLPKLHDRLSKVIATNQDGIKLISKYSNDENTFIYADPLYHHSTRTSVRYNVDMSNDEQERFINECINAKCKILISGYDCDAYKLLEENGFTKVAFVVHTVTGEGNSKKDKTEYLWFNYKV